MKSYKEKISLTKNRRGCYILDTVKGCSAARLNSGKGCYYDCYAARIARAYGFDFTAPVKRCFFTDSNQMNFFGFEDNKHIKNIVKQISKIDMPFIRIGDFGDPSVCWNHTIDVCKKISCTNINIVIITKHFNAIPGHLYSSINKLPITINTSISALDSVDELKHRLSQFNILKNICNSVLRIVSCEFNQNTNEGWIKNIVQDRLFQNDKVIDTVFRPRIDNPFVKNDIIKISKIRFINRTIWASVFNKKTYTGKCNSCEDMCGIYM